MLREGGERSRVEKLAWLSCASMAANSCPCIVGWSQGGCACSFAIWDCREKRRSGEGNSNNGVEKIEATKSSEMRTVWWDIHQTRCASTSMVFLRMFISNTADAVQRAGRLNPRQHPGPGYKVETRSTCEGRFPSSTVASGCPRADTHQKCSDRGQVWNDELVGGDGRWSRQSISSDSFVSVSTLPSSSRTGSP